MCSLPSTNPFLPALLSLIQDIQSMWKLRSMQQHSQTLLHHDNELLCQAKQQITSLYQLHPLVLPTDQHIFQPTLQEHLSNDLSSLCAWLNGHAHYIHGSIQQVHQLHVLHTNQISSYFPPIR